MSSLKIVCRDSTNPDNYETVVYETTGTELKAISEGNETRVLDTILSFNEGDVLAFGFPVKSYRVIYKSLNFNYSDLILYVTPHN